jgi:hypothetical protein
MDPVKRVRAVAASWTTARKGAAPLRDLVALADRAVRLHHELSSARTHDSERRLPTLALMRAVRECEDLVRDMGQILPAMLEEEAEAHSNGWDESPTDPSGPIHVALDPLEVARVTVRGELDGDTLTRSLATLDRTMEAARGLILLDARELHRWGSECTAVLHAWLDARESNRPQRVAVIVQSGLPFVRATEALARLSEIDWSLGVDEEPALRWLLAQEKAPSRPAPGAP